MVLEVKGIRFHLTTEVVGLPAHYRKELSKLEEKLKTLRSEEARTEEELEEISKILQ